MMHNLTDKQFIAELDKMNGSEIASEASRRVRKLMIECNNFKKLCEHLESQLELHEWGDT